jgi:hypothetical protein
MPVATPGAPNSEGQHLKVAVGFEPNAFLENVLNGKASKLSIK